MDELRRGLCPGVLSFGGPHSNHIHALAWICWYYHVPCVLFVRSFDDRPESPTLNDVRNWGAQIRVLSPEEYQRKVDPDQIGQWQKEYPQFIILPEGGSHPKAMSGIGRMMEEVLEVLPHPDIWMCPVGTGSTLAGMIHRKSPDQKIIGIAALKSSVLDMEIRSRWNLDRYPGWVIAQQWHWGGYGKSPGQLRDFINHFAKEHGIVLDPLYNGKAMYAFYQYVNAELIPAGSKVVFIHTGGLQGWRGMSNPIDVK